MIPKETRTSFIDSLIYECPVFDVGNRKDSSFNPYNVPAAHLLHIFAFLETAFSCNLSAREQYDWGHELVYQNATTGVIILYHSRHRYMHITLYQLADGKLIRNPPIPRPGKVYGYTLDELIDDSEEHIRRAQFDDALSPEEIQERLTRYFCRCARKLLYYGSKILAGQFGQFELLSK